ncbi:MAG: transposase [Planctomycetia bacterium]|nr:transposase [Planctomycetia bacterium]
MSKDAPIEVAELPDDPQLLKQLLVQREAVIERVRHEAAERIQSLEERMAAMEAEHKAAILAILRRYYGPRSERFDPRQLLLFGQLIDQMPLDEAGEELTTRRIKNRHKHGRQQLPDTLPRIEIEHDLPDAEKPCPCCGELRQRIGQDISEQLEYFPASFQVLKHVRPKYACPKCEQDGYNPQIAAAPKPPQPIEKGLPGPGLLAYVVTSKLGDHLPLYRLEKIFSRQGVQIARSTMCAWMQGGGDLARPLVDLRIGRIKQSRVIHTDDTTVPVQERGLTTADGRGKCKTGRIWTYLGDGANRIA